MAYVMRCVGEDHEPRRFGTWCPKAISGIGGLPDTVIDRSLVVRLERKPSSHALDRWRDRDWKAVKDLRRRIGRWIADKDEEILNGRRSVRFPPGLHDRARDAWEALLAVANVAGCDWAGEGGRAWRACEKVHADAEDETGAREKLLADLRQVFADAGDPEAMATNQILKALRAMEGRPWSEWKRGQPLSPRGLADLLKPFNVRPTTFRQPGGGTSRGYHRKHLQPVWSAYLQEGGSQSETPQQFNKINGLAGFQSATRVPDVAD